MRLFQWDAGIHQRVDTMPKKQAQTVSLLKPIVGKGSSS